MTTSVAKGVLGSLLGAAISLFLLVSCTTEPSPSTVVELHGRTMGTSYTVRLAPTGEEKIWPPETTALQKQIDQRLAEINRLMSTYDPNSELSRFNQDLSTDWYPVSRETAAVIGQALRIAELTQGAFDPTVGPVVNLWGFGPEKSQTELPSEEQITNTMGYVGYDFVEVRTDPPAVKKESANVYLDLSGIAKGYASDEVSALLAELGFSNSMVEIGGEVRTRGEKGGGNPWLIGVQKPDAQGEPIQMAVPLRDSAMATSGDYRNFYEEGGVRYSHTIDPTTGRPVDHNLASVTIVADNCMEADALATAVLVMGESKGYDWCEQHDLAGLLLVRDAAEMAERRTPRFRELIEK